MATMLAADNSDTEDIADDMEVVIGHLVSSDKKYSAEIVRGDNAVGKDGQRCSVVIDHESLSSLHAVIEAEDATSLTVHDNHSMNGTSLNGNNLEPGVRYDLVHGDKLRMGDVDFVFTLSDNEQKELSVQKSDIDKNKVDDAIFDKETQKIVVNVNDDHNDELFASATQAVLPSTNDKNEDDDLFATATQVVVANNADKDKGDEDEDVFGAPTQAVTTSKNDKVENDKDEDDEDLFLAPTQAVVNRDDDGEGDKTENKEDTNEDDVDQDDIYECATQAPVPSKTVTKAVDKASTTVQNDDKGSPAKHNSKKVVADSDDDDDDSFIMASQPTVRPEKPPLIVAKKSVPIDLEPINTNEEDKDDEEDGKDEALEADTALFECATQAVGTNSSPNNGEAPMVDETGEDDLFECQTQAPVGHPSDKSATKKVANENNRDKAKIKESKEDHANNLEQVSPTQNDHNVTNDEGVVGDVVNETYTVEKDDKETKIVDETNVMDEDDEPTQLMTDTVLFDALNRDAKSNKEEGEPQNNKEEENGLEKVSNEAEDTNKKDKHGDKSDRHNNIESISARKSETEAAQPRSEPEATQPLNDTYVVNESDTVPMETTSIIDTQDVINFDKKQKRKGGKKTQVQKKGQVEVVAKSTDEEVVRELEAVNGSSVAKNGTTEAPKEESQGTNRSQRLREKRQQKEQPQSQQQLSPKKKLKDNPAPTNANIKPLDTNEESAQRPRRRHQELTHKREHEASEQAKSDEPQVNGSNESVSPSKRARREPRQVYAVKTLPKASQEDEEKESKTVDAAIAKKAVVSVSKSTRRRQQPKTATVNSVDNGEEIINKDNNGENDPTEETRNGNEMESNEVDEEPRAPSLQKANMRNRRTNKKAEVDGNVIASTSTKAAPSKPKGTVDSKQKEKSSTVADKGKNKKVKDSSNTDNTTLRRSSRTSKRPNFFNDFVSQVPPKAQRIKNNENGKSKVTKTTTTKAKPRSASKSSVKKTATTKKPVASSTKTKAKTKSKTSETVSKSKPSKSSKWIISKTMRRQSINSNGNKSTSSKAIGGSEWADIKVAFGGDAASQEKQLVQKLGLSVTDSGKDCQLLIANGISVESQPLLLAVAKGVPIVGNEWIKASTEAKEPQDPWNFILEDETSEAKLSFSLKQALKQSLKRQVLGGFKVYCSPSIKPNISELKELIEASGGRLLSVLPSRLTRNLLIISCKTDAAALAEVLDEDAVVHTTDLILKSVLTQSLDLNQHVLKI